MSAKRAPHPSDKWTAEGRRQRNALLAKIHIAKKQLALTDDQYGAILSGLGVDSAKDLTLMQLENLVQYMKYLGWREYRPRRRTNAEQQITALQDRAREMARVVDNGEARLAGLVKSIGKVDALPWLRDTAKLKKILLVMGKFAEQDRTKGGAL